MKRYQLQDPTGQGFPQIVDTCAWKFQWRVSLWPPRIFRQQIGPTYVVAMFSQYCPDALAHAEALCDRLNEYGSAPTLTLSKAPDIHIIDNTGAYTPRPVSVAVVRKWCPNAKTEAEIILEQMNRRSQFGWEGHEAFTLLAMEDE